MYLDKQITAIVVAGGKGLRLGGAVPKQFLPLAGKPMLFYSVEAFFACAYVDEVVVVMPAADMSSPYSKALRELCPAGKKLLLAPGGDTRQESVLKGLLGAIGRGRILVHDAARPFILAEDVERLIECGERNCLYACACTDTAKLTDEVGYVQGTIDRNLLWLAQTPQCFHYEDLLEAHLSAKDAGFTGTDDASLLERLDKPVKILPGSAGNFKITTAADFRYAEFVLNQAIYSAENSGRAEGRLLPEGQKSF